MDEQKPPTNEEIEQEYGSMVISKHRDKRIRRAFRAGFSSAIASVEASI